MVIAFIEPKDLETATKDGNSTARTNIQSWRCERGANTNAKCCTLNRAIAAVQSLSGAATTRAPVIVRHQSRTLPERLSSVVRALRRSQHKRGILYEDKGRDRYIDQTWSLAFVKHKQQSSTQVAALLAVAQQKYRVTLP